MFPCPQIQYDYSQFVDKIILHLYNEKLNINDGDFLFKDSIVISHNVESYYKNIDKDKPELLEKNHTIMFLNFWQNYFDFFNCSLIYPINQGIEYESLKLPPIDRILKILLFLKKLCLKDVETVENTYQKNDNVTIEHLKNIKIILCEDLEEKLINKHITDINECLINFLKRSGHKIISKTTYK